MKTHIRVLFLLLLFNGCATYTRSIRYETVNRPPKSKDYPIEILDSANVKRSYKVIGLVQVDARRYSSLQEAMESLKDEARRMGGDALIDLHQEFPREKSPITSIWDALFGIKGGGEDLWTAKVIVWE